MPRVHPDEVIAAVKAMARADRKLTSKDIAARLAAGEYPDLKPYDRMPLRSIQEHAQRARRDLEPLDDDDLPGMINAIRRDSIRIAQKQVRSLQRKANKAKDGELPAVDAQRLTAWMRVLDGIADKLRAPAPAPAPAKVDAARSEGGKKARANDAGSTSELVHRILGDEDEQDAEAA